VFLDIEWANAPDDAAIKLIDDPPEVRRILLHLIKTGVAPPLCASQGRSLSLTQARIPAGGIAEQLDDVLRNAAVQVDPLFRLSGRCGESLPTRRGQLEARARELSKPARLDNEGPAKGADRPAFWSFHLLFAATKAIEYHLLGDERQGLRLATCHLSP